MNSFKISGTITRKRETEKAVFLRIGVNSETGHHSTLPVTCCKSAYTLAKELREGQMVSAEGSIGNNRKKDSDQWELTLWADYVSAVGADKKEESKDVSF